MQRSSQDAPLSKEAERIATGVLNQDYTTPGSIIAYDEGHYPDPKNKPTVRSLKSNSRCINLPSQNEQAIAFTCRTLTKQNIMSDTNPNRKFRMVTRTPTTHRNSRRHVVCTATEPPPPSFIEHLHEDVNEATSERSIVVSDSTENIQALRADLQAANLGHVTPAANHDDSSFTSSKDRSRDATVRRIALARRRRSKRTSEGDAQSARNTRKFAHPIKEMNSIPPQTTHPRQARLMTTQPVQAIKAKKVFWHSEKGDP
jgi:hypothetical protein